MLCTWTVSHLHNMSFGSGYAIRRQVSIAFWMTLQLSFKISRNRTRIANTTVHIVFGLIRCRVSALISFVNTDPPTPSPLLNFSFPPTRPVAMGIVRLSLNKDDVAIPITTWRLRHTGQSDYTSFPWVNYNIKQRACYARGLYHICIICPLVQGMLSEDRFLLPFGWRFSCLSK